MNCGAYDRAALSLRRWWARELAPALREAVAQRGGLELVPLIARALHRGDEMHNRPAAATSLMLGELAPFRPREAIEYIRDHASSFRSRSMGTAKPRADAARGADAATTVPAMSRTGPASTPHDPGRR